MIPMNAISKTIEVVLRTGAWRATKYISDREIVRATVRRQRGQLRRHPEIVLNIGPPNSVESKFIKLARRAGEPFPIKKIQIKQLPKRRAA